MVALGLPVAVTGAGSVLGGLVTYLAGHDSAGFVLALAFNALSAAWLAVLGILRWRRASSPQ